MFVFREKYWLAPRTATSRSAFASVRRAQLRLRASCDFSRIDIIHSATIVTTATPADAST